MPLYQYLDERDGKVYDVVQGMNDTHEAFAPDGFKLARIWTKPLASVDSKLDPNDAKSFTKYTSTRAGTLGDLQDLSAELSQKRKDKDGVDVVKQNFYDNYAKKRSGRRHINEKKEKLKEIIKNSPFELSD